MKIKIEELYPYIDYGECMQTIFQLYKIPTPNKETLEFYSTVTDTSNAESTVLTLRKNTIHIFLDLLQKNGIITVNKSWFKIIDKNSVFSFYDVSVKRLDILWKLLLQSDLSFTVEPFGESKQLRILVDKLRNKYTKLENDEIVLDWYSFGKNNSDHLHLFKTLEKLLKDDQIDLQILTLRFPGYTDIDTETNNVYDIYLQIKLLNKFFFKWTQETLSVKDAVTFDKNTGNLRVDGQDYLFINDPVSILSDLMDLLIKRIETRVSHDEIADITWGKAKLKTEIEKRSTEEIHDRNKKRIQEIRKKLKSLKLDHILNIVPRNGYMITYKQPIKVSENVKNLLVIKANEFNF